MTLRRTDRSLPIALLRAREAVMEPVREMLAASGLSEQKWRILRVVDEAGALEQSQIAARACLSLPSLTRMLRAMEADGLLTRTGDAEDRRKSIVTLTDQGQSLITAHAEQSNALLADLEAQYGSADLDHLLDLLEKLRTLKF